MFFTIQPFRDFGYGQCRGRPSGSVVPFDRYFDDFFTDVARQLESSFNAVAPYWTRDRGGLDCDFGNALGKIVNDEQKFAIEMDVSHFRPEELKVDLREKELVVEGHHKEREGDSGRIERHFVRKFALPEDAQLDLLTSQLDDKGVLSISAPKNAPLTPPTRNIPITAAPKPASDIAAAPKAADGEHLMQQ